MRRLYLHFKRASEIVYTNAKFSVRKIVKGNTVEWLPMVRAKGLFNDWVPIVKIYDRYVAMPYEKEGGLSEQECIEHIDGYMQQLAKEAEDARFQVDYIGIEEYRNKIEGGGFVAW